MDFNTTTRPGNANGGFIANAASVAAHIRGLGLRVDPADFGGKDLPAGSIVGITVKGGVEYATPAVAGQPAVLTINDVLFSLPTGSTDTVSVITGGTIYGNRLAKGTPTAAQIKDLGTNFVFINANF